MSVVAIKPGYTGTVSDQQANYGDNIMIYIGWDEHLMFCSAKAFLIKPSMTMGQLQEEILPAGFSQHPDFEHIDWSKVQWMLNGESVTFSAKDALGDKGVDHKSLLRFKTPGLNGYKGTGV